MIKLSARLARSGNRLWHWCPACASLHAYVIEAPEGPVWTWNGDAERPTLAPSMLCFHPLPGGHRRTLCHYFLTDGQLQFCGDSPHALAGKTVPLPDLPDWVTS